MTTFQQQIGASLDDTYCRSDANFNVVAYAQFGVITEGKSIYYYDAFVRFLLNIPKGSAINSAVLTLVAYSSRTDAFTSQINFTNEDDAASLGYNPYALADGGTNVAWIVPVFVAGQTVQTVDISSLIRAFINRAGYNGNNHIAIRIKRGDAVTGEYQQFYQWDGASTKAAILTINYTPAYRFSEKVVVRDVFSFVYTPIAVPALVRRLTENLYIISDRILRVATYKRVFRQEIVVRDAFRRVESFLRKLVQNLSTLKDAFTRRILYTRQFAETTFIQDVFKRIVNFPRFFKQDLSSLKIAFSRRVNYVRTSRQTTIISDAFSRIASFPRKLIQNLSVLKDIFSRQVVYTRRFPQTTLIEDLFKRFIGFPRHLAQNLSVLQARFARRVTYLRRVVEDLSVLRDVFSFVYVAIVRIYRFVQTLIIQAFSTRRTSYIRKIQNLTLIQDFFKRTIGFRKLLTQNLSAIKDAFTRKLVYTRKLQQTIIIEDAFKRFTGFPRRLIQDLSALSTRLVRKVVYSRKWIENLSAITDIFKRETKHVRQLIQTILIEAVSTRRLAYVRKQTEVAIVEVKAILEKIKKWLAWLTKRMRLSLEKTKQPPQAEFKV